MTKQINDLKQEPAQKTCLVANEPCKHGSWCSEVYCQEHCKFVGQPEQEPVAYSYTSRITGAQGFSHHPMPRFIDSDSWDIKPLYTSPQPRQWQGLTEEEIGVAFRKAFPVGGVVFTTEAVNFYRAIEAKLREKNA